MARRNKRIDTDKNVSSLLNDKKIKKQITNIDSLISQSNLSLYGTDRTSEIDSLNTKFQELLTDELGNITKHDENNISSFLNQLVSSERKQNIADDSISRQFMNETNTSFASMQSFIYDAYRNRLIEQSDLHEVSSQLIELNEAIMITRDAIISADVVQGKMNRNLYFDNLDDNENIDNKSIVELMEKKFKLQDKIKNFIIPKTLEYGEYYVYCIPYSKLFEDFQRQKENNNMYKYTRQYTESTVLESFNDKYIKKGEKTEDSLDEFLESCYDIYNHQDDTIYIANDTEKSIYDNNKIPKPEFKKDLKNIINNISICNDDIPLPLFEEGFDSIAYMKEYQENVYTESKIKKGDNIFDKVSQSGIIDSDEKKDKTNEFSDITDCYIKMIDPTRMLPIEIMNTTIGYYYVQDDDITPLSGAISSSFQYSSFNDHSRQSTIIDAIATRVVNLFDKPFLKNNIKFKETIVNCFNYYNLNEKRIKFQFIPAEYVIPFKIDEDIHGHGTSMIKKSLFYAKLYLMLLLFKIMSIIMNSNDQKINYIKQSGIDKNLANKVQEIARIQQSRQINITDLFSYTTLIGKVGNGNTVYMPTGRSGERPIETEILAGQDIQLHTELMDSLKTGFILSTGVPNAIINYLQEADFAKVIEQNHSKFNGRVVNYQLDFNEPITLMYQKIMKWSTDIPDMYISNFRFSLQPPKSTNTNTKTELINQFQSYSDFLVNLLYEDPNGSEHAEDLNREIRKFKRLLAREELPMINFDNIDELFEKAKIMQEEEKLKPNVNNGDSGDDIGLDDIEM